MAEVSYFEDLCDGIQEDMETFATDLNNQIKRIADMLNDAASGIGGFFGHLFGDIDDAIDKWNNEILPAIDRMWDDVLTNVWDAVGDLAGRPMSLIDYAKAFSDVKAKIYVEGDLAQKMVIFQHDWKGYAADNYKAVATTEDTGLLNLSMAMDAGSTLTTTAANKILTLWRKLAKEFLGWVGDVLACFEKATEADAIISFEVPAMIEIAKTVYGNIVDLADILVEFLIEQCTTASVTWRQLANGSRGLPQNKWPMVEAANADVLNDPHNYQPA
ncbi:MAG TPA: hypothetical protein VGJ41_13255 [Nocardioides sp.]|jgi:hypothetical protein